MRLLLSAYFSSQEDININEILADQHQCNNPLLASLIAKKPVKDFTSVDCARVRPLIQRLYARSPEKLIVKTHSAIAKPHGYSTIDPDCTFASLFVTRNPLAVLSSFAQHMGVDIDTAVYAMSQAHQTLGNPQDGSLTTLLSSWSAFTRSWIASRRIYNSLIIRYEDLKEDTQGAFSKVLAHIRAPADQNRISRAVHATEFDKMKAQDISQGFKERTKADNSTVFFRSGKTEGWRKELTETHIMATIHHHWDVMEQLDYVPEDLQKEFENIKFDALEKLVDQGTNIGVYAEDLNKLRAKRGIQARLKVNADKTQISHKQARRKKTLARPSPKKTFG